MGIERKKDVVTLRKEIGEKRRCESNLATGSITLEKRFYVVKVKKWVEILQTWAWEYGGDIWEDVFV